MAVYHYRKKNRVRDCQEEEPNQGLPCEGLEDSIYYDNIVLVHNYNTSTTGGGLSLLCMAAVYGHNNKLAFIYRIQPHTANLRIIIETHRWHHRALLVTIFQH